MTNKTNSKHGDGPNRPVLVIEHWYLGFIWDLVLVFWYLG
jgi:hypothetical protein